MKKRFLLPWFRAQPPAGHGPPCTSAGRPRSGLPRRGPLLAAPGRARSAWPRVVRGLALGAWLLAAGPGAAQPASPRTRYWEAGPDSLRRVLAGQRADTARLRTLMHLADVAPLARGNRGVLAETEEVAALSARLHRPERRAYRLLAAGNRLLDGNAPAPALDSLQAAVAAFDRLGRPVPWLLGDLRVLYNRLNRPEAKGAYYRAKLAGYRRRGAWENTAACWHGLAGYYASRGDYNRAVGCYLEAAARYRTVMRYQSYALLAAAGSVYADWGNPEKGLFYLRRSIALEGPRAGNFAYLHLARAELRLGHYPAARRALDRCLAVGQWGGMAPATGRAHATLLKSAVLLAQGRPAAARPLLEAAQHLADSLGLGLYDTAGNFELDATWARYHAARGDAPRAEARWLAAYRRARQSNLTPLRLAYLQELARFYQRRHRPEAAAYAVAALGLADSLRTAEGRLHVAQYEIEQATRAQSARIAALRARQQRDAARARRQRRALGAALGGAALLVALAAVLYRAFRRSERLKRLVTAQKQALQAQRDQLDASLTDLRTTQAQLIQKEKMASLGELTAGIAHEMQNPLNFVTNFADVSTELVAELKAAQAAGETGEVTALADELTQNLVKITAHGQRAAGIVRGMLQHSRASTGERQPTDLNALTDESLRLAYQGLRATDKSFHATLGTDLAVDVPRVSAVGADLGRVLLNLFNNAFYAVRQRQRLGEPGYQPTVRVHTKRAGDTVEIRVSDNGPGIPAEVQAKIFQPFFTTKPPGEGTGLGLSLAHDIIAQGHGGTLRVESEVGRGTTFTIRLPATGSS
jgi:two-component system NtrC family sensor kinase